MERFARWLDEWFNQRWIPIMIVTWLLSTRVTMKASGPTDWDLWQIWLAMLVYPVFLLVAFALVEILGKYLDRRATLLNVWWFDAAFWPCWWGLVIVVALSLSFSDFSLTRGMGLGLLIMLFTLVVAIIVWRLLEKQLIRLSHFPTVEEGPERDNEEKITWDLRVN